MNSQVAGLRGAILQEECKRDSEFGIMNRNLEEAKSRLEKAVMQVADTFSPALRNVPTCETKEIREKSNGDSELESAIWSTISSIEKACNLLNSLRERSSI